MEAVVVVLKHYYQGYEQTRNLLVRVSISEAWVIYVQVRLTSIFNTMRAAYNQGQLTIE